MDTIYKVIGMMSGTSLDGVDIAFCEFAEKNNGWYFKILASEIVKYDSQKKEMLQNLHKASGKTLMEEHKKYGRYLGSIINDFRREHDLHPDLIASHGHTIFHEPASRFNFQLGDGISIALASGCPVVSDFRSLDIELGGHGAPLVPVGDRLLFGDYDCCLNLGGFSNISYESENGRMAFDICPVNIILDLLSQRLGYPFDNKGELASGGNLMRGLYEKLNDLNYYESLPPKSLGREWFESVFLPVVNSSRGNVKDLLRTVCDHIAFQLVNAISKSGAEPSGKILVSGGGAKNDFLTGLIRKSVSQKLIIPEDELVDYKEALVFAFLGVLRWRNEINCLCSVTGARRDSSCGTIYLP